MGATTSVAADLEDSGAAATRVNFFNNKFYSVGLARVELVHPEPVLALLAINVIFSSMRGLVAAVCPLRIICGRIRAWIMASVA